MSKNPRADRDWFQKLQSRERLGDFAHTLSRIDWDIFSTLTFRDPIPRPHVCYGMAWQWCRALGEAAKVPYNRLLIALRGEFGEENGRFHFHALVGGTTARNMTTFCHQAFWQWRHIAGCPRTEVRPFNRSLAGADYICKCLGANAYEVGKFNWADQVTLSRSVFTLVRVQERRCQAQAGRLEKDAAANTLGKDSGAMSPARAAIDTARFAATSAAITQNTVI